MRKFFTFLFSFVVVLLLVGFFVVLNLRLSLLSPSNLKEIAKDSQTEKTVAVIIRNQIVEESGMKLNDGKNFDQLNAAINAETVEPLVDKVINNFFDPVTQVGSGISASHTFSIEVTKDLSLTYTQAIPPDFNHGFVLLRWSQTALVVSSMVLFALLVLVLVMQKSSMLRFEILLKILFMGSLTLTIVWAGLYYLVPNVLNNLLSSSDLASDQMVANGFSNLVSTSITWQNNLFAIEVAALFLLYIIFAAIAKTGQRSDLGSIDKKI